MLLCSLICLTLVNISCTKHPARLGLLYITCKDWIQLRRDSLLGPLMLHGHHPLLAGLKLMWMALNNNRPSSTACGGLVRDDHGRFIHGFYCKVGFCNAICAELWALRLGIKVAQVWLFPR